MIPRYTLPEMGNIWTEENKYRIWLQIEVLACRAQANIGAIPADAADEIERRSAGLVIDVDRILEIEETTKHDIIAFLTFLEENIGETARFIHLGMTSSDVLDTCLGVQLKQAGELLLEDLNGLLDVLARRAVEFKHTPCIGRSHGIHAEPITFGMKIALWHDECRRNVARMKKAVDTIAVGKINGAVGTFEHISTEVELFVCKGLGLEPAPVTTQVISRDRHAEFMAAIALCGSMLEKIATEIRHLQRTEVLEAEEKFTKGQKGSSAMPHKRNPISSENICGQARLLRSNLLAAIENNALWHERDISHSSVERIILPDSTISLDYILNRTIKLVDGLVVYPEKMIENLELTRGLIFSQKVLIELTRRGAGRQHAYELVQKAAMRSWDEKKQFFDCLIEMDEIMKFIPKAELKALFGFEEIFKNIDYIFSRCGL